MLSYSHVEKLEKDFNEKHIVTHRNYFKNLEGTDRETEETRFETYRKDESGLKSKTPGSIAAQVPLGDAQQVHGEQERCVPQQGQIKEKSKMKMAAMSKFSVKVVDYPECHIAFD